MLSSFFESFMTPIKVGVVLLILGLAGAVWTLNSSLATANQSIGKLTTERDNYKADLERIIQDSWTKERLNLELRAETAALRDTHTKQVAKLNARIEELQAKRPGAIIEKDGDTYIKEEFLDEAADVVIDEMWSTYCSIFKHAPECVAVP